MMSDALSRRGFLMRGAGLAAGGVMSLANGRNALGANNRINMAVIGIRGRGWSIARQFASLPDVRIATLCDIDENLFPERVKDIGDRQDFTPSTETDLRRVLENKDIDCVAIATADHWHALAAILSCQAGKHVYLEKPTSHNIWEGRKVVEAARKYNRIVAAGMQNRSIMAVRAAMRFLHEGGIGEVYMAKGLCFKPRDSIGRMQDTPVPRGVHYDLWLGPAPKRPFNPNRFHYNWHWCWDYGCADIGNQGPHQMDLARWGLEKTGHPRKIKSVGGYFAHDSDQETPNTQFATFEYDDGRLIQFEVRGLYTNDENGILIGNLFYGSKGWMHLNGSTWKTYYGRSNVPGLGSDQIDLEAEEAADPLVLTGTGGSGIFGNFIESLRAGDGSKLSAAIIEGHMTSTMSHLANISCRLGRELTFDSTTERFVGDDEADSYLTREYRTPFVVPEKV